MPRYPALAVSASLLWAALHFAGFAFAKTWPAALLGWDSQAETPLKTKSLALPSSWLVRQESLL